MTKHHLTLRPTVVDGADLDNDYVIRRDRRPVGRIHLADAGAGTTPVWEWTINVPLLVPPWGAGRAASLENAKCAFRNAWVLFYESLSPAHIEQWHRQQDTDLPQSFKWP